MAKTNGSVALIIFLWPDKLVSVMVRFLEQNQGILSKRAIKFANSEGSCDNP